MQLPHIHFGLESSCQWTVVNMTRRPCLQQTRKQQVLVTVKNRNITRLHSPKRCQEIVNPGLAFNHKTVTWHANLGIWTAVTQNHNMKLQHKDNKDLVSKHKLRCRKCAFEGVYYLCSQCSKPHFTCTRPFTMKWLTKMKDVFKQHMY